MNSRADRSRELEEIVQYKVNKSTIDLYKYFLILLEDLRNQNFVINQNTYEILRKKVLDQGNAIVRDNETFLNKFEYKVKSINNLEK